MRNFDTIFATDDSNSRIGETIYIKSKSKYWIGYRSSCYCIKVIGETEIAWAAASPFWAGDGKAWNKIDKEELFLKEFFSIYEPDPDKKVEIEALRNPPSLWKKFRKWHSKTDLMERCIFWTSMIIILLIWMWLP